ncbi:MAG: ABC transporter ATP-binding protein [Planctomycetota bacterium]|nr:ABC transporter ATP-binding protein [Planctomycetota bacterium]
MPEPDLVLEHVAKKFHGGAGEVAVLADVNLTLSQGEALAITGPSGSGKSTLLYIIGTLDTPSAGTVRIEGHNPFILKEEALAAFRNRAIGFVFQDHYLLPQCTVLENVLIPTLAASAAITDVEQRATQLLERVGLSQRLRHRPAELSGGERQRVAICRALINQPRLLLADEPTGNLDRNNAESIGTLLLEVCRELSTVLIAVTHSAELACRFPRKGELVDGRLEER